MNSKIMFLWGFLIVMICASLLVLGNIGNDYTLYKLERNLKLSSKTYLEKNNRMPEYNETEIVYVNELIDSEIIKEDPNIDKYCIKEIMIKKGLLFNKYEVYKECKVEMKQE